MPRMPKDSALESGHPPKPDPVTNLHAVHVCPQLRARSGLSEIDKPSLVASQHLREWDLIVYTRHG